MDSHSAGEAVERIPMAKATPHLSGEDVKPHVADRVGHEKDFPAVAAPSTTVTWGLDHSRIFAMTETTDEQLRRVQRERDSHPAKTERTMRRGQLLVRFAREGRLRDIDQIVSRCPSEEMLTWFVVRMFKEACMNNRLQTIVFMVGHALDVKFHPMLEAVHWVVEGCDEERDGIDVVPTLDFLITVAGIQPDEQRQSDFHTPLHVAIQRGLFQAARRLIELGADINAVAKEDAMPLTLAEQPVAEDGSSTTAATVEIGHDDCGDGMTGTTSTDKPKMGGIKTRSKESYRLVHTGGAVLKESEREGRDQGNSRARLLVTTEGNEGGDEDGGPGGSACQPSPSPSSDSALDRQRRRVAASRARICGLLVERGARRTWRRGRSEAQVALDDKYRRLLLEGDDGRNFCTFNG